MNAQSTPLAGQSFDDDGESLLALASAVGRSVQSIGEGSGVLENGGQGRALTSGADTGDDLALLGLRQLVEPVDQANQDSIDITFSDVLDTEQLRKR